MNPHWKTLDIPTHLTPNAVWVEAVAHIRNNETGEIRQYVTQELLRNGESTPNVFNWEENNYRCDCNRHLFFERANGGDPDLDDTECSHGKYSVNLQNPMDGQFYYTEYEH